MLQKQNVSTNKTNSKFNLQHTNLDKIAISVKSQQLLKTLMDENPQLKQILEMAKNESEALENVRNWVLEKLSNNQTVIKFYEGATFGRKSFEALGWKDIAAIRILDYVKNAERTFSDLNLKGELAVSNPIKLLWLAISYGTGGAKPYFFEDMIHLFRQLRGAEKQLRPNRETIEKWMSRYACGLDNKVVLQRKENRNRIIKVIIKKIDNEIIKSKRYNFQKDMSSEEKYLTVLKWWDDWRFHLRFAVRNPDDLNEMLGHSLDPDTMKLLCSAKEAGIPFFVNPYYLSLLHVRVPSYSIGDDLAIRHYVLYSKQLVDEFGKIAAWEKEDQVEPGKPNAAGWILPYSDSIHRRYPEVAIVIPDSVGRACGGLCASCQRMFGFQKGNLNFNLNKLKPTDSWKTKLKNLMDYFENDSQLRDILITGGDALMSSDKTIKNILDAVYEMAIRKKKNNKDKKNKFAEILRVRLGSRLPIYLPQRVTPELLKILCDFKNKATKIGIKQFIIQTHFESPLEVTPEAKHSIDQFLSCGWMVTNQHVMTTASSRRGHINKLRKVMNDIGIINYYTFSVKGYMENYYNFATNARAMQEQIEEKSIGIIPNKYIDEMKTFPDKTTDMVTSVDTLKNKAEIPFLATDRNVLNLPGVGKSLTYRVIGITRYGRRILEFDHDATRNHSPIIAKIGKVIVVESKAIGEYLFQLEELGEDVSEYKSIYGYSIGETEPRANIFEYPDYDFEITNDLTNLNLD